MTIRDIAEQAKTDSFAMASVTGETRDRALKAVADSLREEKAAIMAANEADMKAARENGLPEPVLKRLKFDEAKLEDVISGIESLISMGDPLYKVQLQRELDEGLKLIRVSCPIGVIGVIFEARPDALVQIASLCLRTGNCVIVKGGSEAARTNRVLSGVIKEAVTRAGIPTGFISQIETHQAVNDLLACDEFIDLIIPRGSNSFVQYIMANTKIPVMGHADGICHIYVDSSADVEKAVRIITDAKTQYVAACNTVETLLVHRDAAKELFPALKKSFDEKNVLLKGTGDVRRIVDCEEADEKDFRTEYLDYVLSAKIVENVDQAVSHINKYGSHHTDCIITEDDETAERFMLTVDSAGVYRNCSTRFADGFRYGFGAEVGISTGKLHARGPVGVEGLLTYKYKLYGDGHIVGDYASGKRSFRFKDL